MKNLNRIHLSGLRAVEAVGRLGSLRLAAAELGVTIGAVSQQILKTEKQLECVLFERHPKGLVTTNLGERLCAHLTTGMAALSNGVNLVEKERSGTLTVSVPPVFAGKWLVWRLSDFYQAHPDIRIRVDASQELVDPNNSDVDVCIRVGWGDWKGVRVEKLLDQRIFPVCTPQLAAQLKTPSDLAKVPLISEPNSMFDWSTWLIPNGYGTVALGDGPVFSDASLCLDAAIAGQGVFLAWETLANDAIVNGCLVAPFAGRAKTGISYWFVLPQNSKPTKAVLAFQAWLRSALESSPAM